MKHYLTALLFIFCCACQPDASHQQAQNPEDSVSDFAEEPIYYTGEPRQTPPLETAEETEAPEDTTGRAAKMRELEKGQKRITARQNAFVAGLSKVRLKGRFMKLKNPKNDSIESPEYEIDTCNYGRTSDGMTIVVFNKNHFGRREKAKGADISDQKMKEWLCENESPVLKINNQYLFLPERLLLPGEVYELHYRGKNYLALIAYPLYRGEGSAIHINRIYLIDYTNLHNIRVYEGDMYEAEYQNLGDFNGDGRIDLAEVVKLFPHIVQGETHPAACCNPWHDGEILCSCRIVYCNTLNEKSGEFETMKDKSGKPYFITFETSPEGVKIVKKNWF